MAKYKDSKFQFHYGSIKIIAVIIILNALI